MRGAGAFEGSPGLTNEGRRERLRGDAIVAGILGLRLSGYRHVLTGVTTERSCLQLRPLKDTFARRAAIAFGGVGQEKRTGRHVRWRRCS